MLEYEKAFVQAAKMARLRLSRDEDSCPQVTPRPGKRNRGIKLFPFSPAYCQFTVQRESAQSMLSVVRRLRDLGITTNNALYGDTEASLLFPLDHLSRVAAEFGMVKRAGNPKNPPTKPPIST
jgi:hypothetical protein